MAKTFEQAVKFMEDTWKDAGSPTDWTLEKWDGITNGALSRMLQVVVSSVPRDELIGHVGHSRPALAEQVDTSGNLTKGPPVQQNVNPYDYLFKVVLAGDSGVGKSSMFFRYTDDHFNTDYKPTMTIGIDFATKFVNVEHKVIRSQIWDLAGHERFRTITTAYYRGAMGVMLVYDISDRKTFNNISSWLAAVREHGQANVVIMLIGNKSDLKDSRQVLAAEAQAFATDNGLLFAEVSVYDTSSVEGAFLTFLTEILRVRES